MFDIPPYIANARVVDRPIEYDWKPYLGMELIQSYSTTIESLANRIAIRATLTLGLGIAEWMLWRIDAKSHHPQVFFYWDALWTATIAGGYLESDEPVRTKDTGDKVEGPLRALEQLLADLLTKATLDLPERGKSVAQLVTLVRYTLPHPGDFDSWLKAVLDRFTKSYPYDPDDPGPKVPRAFLNPAVTPDEVKVPVLLDEELQTIDWRGNPFLATPEKMVEAGFEGTPYRYLS
jgi:hypothetical protein